MSESAKQLGVAYQAIVAIIASAPTLEGTMNLSDNRFPANHISTDAHEGPEVPAVLARWYAAHASVRRLWAVEDQDALTVFITLEPTSDGDDAFPTWLAKSHDWAGDLQERTNREVQLKLIVAGIFEEPDIDEGGTMIAELSWRDSWLTFE